MARRRQLGGNKDYHRRMAVAEADSAIHTAKDGETLLKSGHCNTALDALQLASEYLGSARENQRQAMYVGESGPERGPKGTGQAVRLATAAVSRFQRKLAQRCFRK